MTNNKHLSTFKIKFDISQNPPIETNILTIEKNIELPVISDISDDVGPLQGRITTGGLTDDSTPTLSGHAERGKTVQIFTNGDFIGAVPVRPDGSWSFTPTTPLPDGKHSFTITLKDEATGTVTDHSTPHDVLIDTAPPGRPTLKSIYDSHGSQTGYYTNGSVISDSKPVIYGRSEPGSTTRIYDDGVEIGHVIADDTGNWSFTPDTDLQDGEHHLTLTAFDGAGNYSQPSSTFSFTIDSKAPGKPEITRLLDNHGQHTGEIPFGGITDDNTPQISGTAEAGSLITIFLNDVEWDAVFADERGNWVYDPTLPFFDGEHSLSVTATDSAGNTSEPSNAFVFVVNTTPSNITITTALDDQGPNTGAIPNGGLTDDGTPTIQGRANANSLIKIYDSGILIGQTQSNAAGTWAFTPPNQLSEGLHQLTATVTVAGQESAHSSSFTLTIDRTPPENLGISQAINSAGETLLNGDSTNEKQPTFIGKGEPGSIVTLVSGNTWLGKAVIDANGHWSFTPTQPLDEGSHLIRIALTDSVGNNSAPSADFEIVIDTVAPDAPVISSIVDDAGQETGTLTQGAITDDNQPTLIGSAEPNSIVSLFNGTSLIATVHANIYGQWIFTPTNELPDGNYQFRATATDQAGNTSSSSTIWSITINTVTPPPAKTPTITQVYDDVGESVGALLPNDETDDLRPTLYGTAKPGKNLLILLKYQNGSSDLLGTITVGTSGNWSFTPEQNLPLGKHEFILYQDDQISAPWPIILIENQSAHLPPVITAVYETLPSSSNLIDEGGSTLDQTPLIQGRAKASSIVIIKNGETIIGTTTADTAGNWSFEPTLQYGSYNLTAISLDQNGSYSQPSESFSLTVATSAQYDFENFDIGIYNGPAPTVNGITFTSQHWWWEETQIVKVGDTKAGLAEGICNITVDWPEQASQASFNIWSTEKADRPIQIKLLRDNTLVDEIYLDEMPITPNESLIKINTNTGTFNKITISCGNIKYYIDNISFISGTNPTFKPHDASLENSNSTDWLIYDDNQNHQTNSSKTQYKPATSELLLDDLLEHGTASLFNNDNQNTDKTEIPTLNNLNIIEDFSLLSSHEINRSPTIESKSELTALETSLTLFPLEQDFNQYF